MLVIFVAVYNFLFFIHLMPRELAWWSLKITSNIDEVLRDRREERKRQFSATSLSIIEKKKKKKPDESQSQIVVQASISKNKNICLTAIIIRLVRLST